MNTSNYQLAFTLRVAHSYFGQNMCNCLRFEPGPGSQSILQRYDVKKRDFTNGFDLYINTRSALPDFLDHITISTGNNFFDFDIHTTIPEFNLFTNLPTDHLNQLMYDSSYASNTTDGKIIQLNAANFPGGSQQRLGSLTVRFADIDRAGGNTQFGISYVARSTQWQYYVINRNAIQLSNPAITGKDNIVFDGPEIITLDNGQQAMLFTSGNNLIPLSRIPKYKFDLINTPSPATNQQRASARVIFRGLPTPDPVRIGITAISGQVASPMYIYI